MRAAAPVTPTPESAAPASDADEPAREGVEEPAPAALPAQAPPDCVAGDAAACYRAGWDLVHGENGAVVDDVAGRALIQRACDLDSPKACGFLGLRAEFGKGDPLDYDVALRYYVRGCELGEAESSCANAGRLVLLAERARPAELARAATWLRAACDAGHSDGCFNAGIAYERGKKRLDEARALYRRACDLGFADGCVAERDLATRGAPRPADGSGAELDSRLRAAAAPAEAPAEDPAPTDASP